MKKFVLALFIPMALLSCEKEEELVINKPKSQAVITQAITDVTTTADLIEGAWDWKQSESGKDKLAGKLLLHAGEVRMLGENNETTFQGTYEIIRAKSALTGKTENILTIYSAPKNEAETPTLLNQYVIASLSDNVLAFYNDESNGTAHNFVKN